jgi:hypothetical protein
LDLLYLVSKRVKLAISEDKAVDLSIGKNFNFLDLRKETRCSLDNEETLQGKGSWRGE